MVEKVEIEIIGYERVVKPQEIVIELQTIMLKGSKQSIQLITIILNQTITSNQYKFPTIPPNPNPPLITIPKTTLTLIPHTLNLTH